MISTVPPLFEDERKQEANNYEQNMRNMQALLVSRLLEQTATRPSHTKKKGKDKKDKGKKTKGKSTAKKTSHTQLAIPPRFRANLRQQLLQRQQARPASYAQPYVSQQEEKLQQAKDQAIFNKNQLVNYQAAIQQQKEEARINEVKLKEAKAKNKAETKRADEAERRNAELEKQQAAYEDARARYQKAMHEGELGELELQNASLLSKVKMLEFAITDRKAKIAENKVAHSNEVLQTEVDSLTAERDALTDLLKTDIYSKSVATQAALVKKKKELELQLDLKKKELEQLAKNHELKVQLNGMPSAFSIRTMNNHYDRQIAYALTEQSSFNTGIALKEDLIHEVDAKRKVWKDSVTKREKSRAELARLMQEEATVVAPTDDDIAAVNTEIANLSTGIDTLSYMIENAKSARGRYDKLANRRDDLIDELTRENSKAFALMKSSAPMVNAIPKIASEIGEKEVELESVKNAQEPYIHRGKQLATLNERLSTAGNNVTIEQGRLGGLVKRKPAVVKKIRKTLGNIASAEATLDQTRALYKAQQEANDASDNLHAEEQVEKTMEGSDWVGRSLKLVKAKMAKRDSDERRLIQKELNDAERQRIKDAILPELYGVFGNKLDLHAHQVDSNVLNEHGLTNPKDQAIALNALSGVRKHSADVTVTRERVASEGADILKNTNMVDSYNDFVKTTGAVNILDPGDVTEEQYKAGVAGFREHTDIPNAFNDVYHDQ